MSLLRKAPALKKADCKISDRFAGFITFGSPLDKIAFFFRERIDENSEVRKQILNSYHSFKRKNFETEKKYYYTVTTNTKTLLDDVRWLNFYDRKDYISGHLDFYNLDENINCKLTPRFFTHDDYWCSNLMHEKTFDLIVKHTY